ncbi:protein D3-like [Bradysia coprophila]|uniref:protein D3-like n=1 Tax=Bradysia coprophila TaxID=38358 RepID=UPI00187DD17E|nr:protein D3-like [Bradysia coprophila]
MIMHKIHKVLRISAIATLGTQSGARNMTDHNLSTEVEQAFLKQNILKVVPKKILHVTYQRDITVGLGNELGISQVKEKPQVTWEAKESTYYTLMLIDPDALSRRFPILSEVRHWLVMNIPGSAVENGDEVIEYRGSGASRFTGLHRYIFLVYKQPNGIITHNEPHTSNASIIHRLRTSASKLAKKYNLGDPEFGNFFEAQYGT